MEEKNMGKFIAELRKDKKMTQKELAARLHITDKAVSKWERSLSCPDIALLPAVADVLGVGIGGSAFPDEPNESLWEATYEGFR